MKKTDLPKPHHQIGAAIALVAMMFGVVTPYSAIIVGTTADDTLIGTVTADTLEGLEGDDILEANEGNDILYGDDGDDTLEGHEGDDVLSGGAGNDYVYGYDGDDTYHWSWGDGHDLTSDSYTGAGSSTLQLGDGVLAEHITFETDNISAETYLEGWQNDPAGISLKLIFSHPTDEALSGSIVIYDWVGTKSGWEVRLADGSIWNEASIRANGDASIVGGAGDDVLLGGDANDTLTAELGNDTLTGGKGHDLLYGGDGADIYEWSLGDGRDYILDEDATGGKNKIQLGEGILPEHVSVATGSVNADNYLLGWGHNSQGEDIRLEIIDPADASQSGAIVIENWEIYHDDWEILFEDGTIWDCLLYTSPSPRDLSTSRMPSSA